MTTSTPTTEPGTINPGDTVKWTRSLPDYPANDGWVLSYELVNATARYSFSAGTSGADHTVTIAANVSAGYLPGAYDWRARVAKASEIFTVGSGRLNVNASFASATDVRSHARKVLGAIDAYFENSQNLTAARYMIAGRELWRIPITELLKLRDRYRQDIAREDAAQRAGAGLPNPGRIFVRHVRDYSGPNPYDLSRH